MSSKPIQKLDSPGSGCGDIQLTYHDLSLVLDYEFRKNGKDQIGHVRFLGVAAFRFRDEPHSVGFVPESYDVVVEIHNSEWLEQMRSSESSGASSIIGVCHYSVFVSNNGYLEVLAENVHIDSTTVGLLGG